MKVLFCRNTHDKNGKLYWWLKGKETEDFYGLGVHALTKEGTTFDQYIYNHISYANNFPDYNVPTYIELLDDLIKMIKIGVCVVKDYDNEKR